MPTQDADVALPPSEELFRTLADNISQLAWMADAKGSIFWFNRRWYEFTGTTLDETFVATGEKRRCTTLPRWGRLRIEDLLLPDPDGIIAR